MFNAQRSSLCSRLRAVLAWLSILVLVPGVLLAKEKDSKEKDYCIGFPGHGGFALVGQGFVIPDKGKCDPWTGFFIPNENSPSAGTACTATDGSDLSITITSSTPGNPVTTGHPVLVFQSLCPFRRRLAQTSKQVLGFRSLFSLLQ
jgi:hypothetical protein